MTVGTRDQRHRQLEALLQSGTAIGLSDRQLLERFATEGDQQALAALVDRHGAMVMHAWRGVLGRQADAEDAIRAVFLLLARRARRLAVDNSLGPSLCAVAWRVARDTRKAIPRRDKLERIRRAEPWFSPQTGLQRRTAKSG